MAAPKKSVEKESGQKANVSPPEFTKAQELAALRDMLLIRRFEEKAGQLYGMGAIGGFCHLYIGQEAVVVGMQMALKQGDQVITGYRDHGHMLACGMEANGVMAELTGRRHGYSKGKGGSMHMFSVAKNFYGGHGIVGAPAPLGTGLALANKYRGNDRVSLTYFGEGAALPTWGVTIGLSAILAAGTIWILATGESKADIVRDVLLEPVSTTRPASLLRGHANCWLFLDAAAASKLPVGVLSRG